MSFFKKYTLIVCFLFVTSITTRKAVLFDVGEVLLTTYKNQAISTMGYSNTFWYIAQTWNPPSFLKFRAYQFLTIYLGGENPEGTKDHHGNILPYIFWELMSGFKDFKECLHMIDQAIQNHPDFFESETEKKLIRTIYNFMFEPKTLASITTLNPEGMQLLCDCKKEGHEIFILSNYPPRAWEQIIKKFPEISSFVPPKNQIVSGFCYSSKPNKEIYTHAIEAIQNTDIHVCHKNCYFIDDQEENGLPAYNLGITFVLAKSIFKARIQLEQLGVLKSQPFLPF